MKQEPYLKVFTTEAASFEWMRMKNKTSCDRSIFCQVEHPEGWAVVDLRTAIELENGYTWSL